MPCVSAACRALMDEVEHDVAQAWQTETKVGSPPREPRGDPGEDRGSRQEMLCRSNCGYGQLPTIYPNSGWSPSCSLSPVQGVSSKLLRGPGGLKVIFKLEIEVSLPAPKFCVSSIESEGAGAASCIRIKIALPWPLGEAGGVPTAAAGAA